MIPVGFEPTISKNERPQTDALDRAATGTGKLPLSHIRVLRENDDKFRNGKKVFLNGVD
jgi:hypothetical protein